MRTIAGARALQDVVATYRRDGARIGLVPTMGNLHAGHYSLVDALRDHCDVVVASVFVNPTQFAPGEDFATYPRTPEADAEGLAARGCDILFLPSVEDLYPLGLENTVSIRVPGLRDVLEGAIRPGHFDGVATIVAKLFNAVQPQVAVFGRKDFQQWLVIRRMVADLAYPIEIVGAPIVREANGLAMSSRNQYLDADQRDRAAVIHECLLGMRDAIHRGAEPAAVEADASARLASAGLVPDYAVVRSALDLGPPLPERPRIALVAARMGRTRLIDNEAIDP